MGRGRRQRQATQGRKKSRVGSRIGVAFFALTAFLAVTVISATESGSVYADTGDVAYQCTSTGSPETIFADVTGTIPSDLSAGTVFYISNYQINVLIPADVVQDLADSGRTVLSGVTDSTVGAKGATPSSMPVPTGGWGPFGLSASDPAPIAFSIPAEPVTVGPFTAKGGPVTMTELGSTTAEDDGFSTSCTPDSPPVIAQSKALLTPNVTQRPGSLIVTTGTPDTDTAEVTGSGATDPDGSVNFFVCGPTQVSEPCTSQGTPVGGSPLDDSEATSPSFTPSKSGTWCFAAYYSGSSIYSPDSDTDTDGCFDVNPAAITTCQAKNSCTANQTTSSGTVIVTGTSSTKATIQLSLESDTASGCGSAWNTPAQYSELTESNFTSTSSLDVVLTVDKTSVAKASAICYKASAPFVDASGTSVTTGLLPTCAMVSNTPPCIVSGKKSGANAVLSLIIPAGDPAFHAGQPPEPKKPRK
jgi:hypothetical protein